jgi:NAD(P)-dependent dehydrogenase (short-subunit alcohol dehydrogenase family)
VLRFLEEVQKSWKKQRNRLGHKALAIQADTARLDEIDKFVRAAVDELKKVHVLFVNASVAKYAPLAATPESLYDEHFDINVKGARTSRCIKPFRTSTTEHPSFSIRACLISPTHPGQARMRRQRLLLVHW